MTDNLPRSRQDLTVKELEGELLVYDEKSKKAFCLNSTSALVWKMCDGETTTAKMVEGCAQSLGAPIDATFVTFALEQLRKDGLLEPGFEASGGGASVTRAQVVRRIGRVGIAAAVVVPLVSAVMAPTAAKAYGSGPPRLR